jgi:hypothetical protein
MLDAINTYLFVSFYTFTDEPRFPYKNGVYYNAGEVTLAYPSLVL